MTKGATRLIPKEFKQTWKTPKALYQQLNGEFNFDYDPCPPLPSTNGIFSDWGERNFVNPPYGKPIASWLRKGIEQKRKGKLSVFLLPSYTDVKWFHELVLRFASEIRFIKGRLDFNDLGTTAPFAVMLVIFDPAERGPLTVRTFS